MIPKKVNTFIHKLYQLLQVSAQCRATNAAMPSTGTRRETPLSSTNSKYSKKKYYQHISKSTNSSHSSANSTTTASKEPKKESNASHTPTSSEIKSIFIIRNLLPNIQRNAIHKKISMDATADAESPNDINFEEMVFFLPDYRFRNQT